MIIDLLQISYSVFYYLKNDKDQWSAIDAAILSGNHGKGSSLAAPMGTSVVGKAHLMGSSADERLTGDQCDESRKNYGRGTGDYRRGYDAFP